MPGPLIIYNAVIVNEGQAKQGSLYINNGIIESIFYNNIPAEILGKANMLDATGKYLLPGVIDDQVHFRDPGLTHKGDIGSESRAGIAGGVTSFMDMPNTDPQTVTKTYLDDKYRIAKEKSWANYSFYIGATNNNLDEILSIPANDICGIKIFMGSSTGNMLVDNEAVLKELFSNISIPIAVHCEYEPIVRSNLEAARAKYGDNIPFSEHPVIRSEEACYRSSSIAVELASRFNTRLHLLHLSTEKELSLLSNKLPLEQKRITGEVCVHHLWFTDEDYERLGSRIKWNPAIKSRCDRDALIEAVLNNTIDIVATDHAPHLLSEKNNDYMHSPSGGPLIQHSLVAMLEFAGKGVFDITHVVTKMCHHPAILFGVSGRGFIREGYHADIVLVDINSPWNVEPENILYKCGWSPFEGQKFNSKVTHTFVNGELVYDNGEFYKPGYGQRLIFKR